jgi:uncharacterized protein YjbI with pentapeptide repeats
VEACCFDGADLTDASWVGARFTDCSFIDARLRRQDGRAWDPRGSARDATFIGCDLRGADVDGLRLANTRFERCDISALRGRPTIEGEVVVTSCTLPLALTDGSAWMHG